MSKILRYGGSFATGNYTFPSEEPPSHRESQEGLDVFATKPETRTRIALEILGERQRPEFTISPELKHKLARLRD